MMIFKQSFAFGFACKFQEYIPATPIHRVTKHYPDTRSYLSTIIFLVRENDDDAARGRSEPVYRFGSFTNNQL